MELKQPTLKAAQSAAEDQLQARQEEAESHRAQLEQDQETLALEASASHLEKEAARQELELERESLREEQGEAARRFGEQLTELQSLRAEMDRERAAIQVERAAWQEQVRSHFVEPAATEPSVAESAVEDEPAREDVSDQITQTGDEHEVPCAEASAAPASDEEQSIEEYMAALMHRTRGSSGTAPVVISQPKRNKRKSDAVAPADQQATGAAAATSPVVETQCVVDMPMVATELTRRSPAETTDLSAMRALCNIQARSAIDTHGKKRLMRTALAASSGALGSLFATIVVLQITSADHQVIRTGAMAGLVIAVFWVYSASLAARQLLASRRLHEVSLKANLERATAKQADEPAVSSETV